MDKTQEKIAEEFLDQGIRELLWSFHKNGGDLDYCVRQIRNDFRKAGYCKLPEGKPPLLSDGEIQKAFKRIGKTEKLDKYGMYGVTRTTTTYDSKAVAQAQRDSDIKWMRDEEC